MENIKLKRLVIVKDILENYSISLPSYRNFSFFDYYIQRKQLEFFNNCFRNELKLKIATIKKNGTHNRYRWIRRVMLSVGIMFFSYGFMHIPNAIACNYILKNKVAITSIWQLLRQTKERKNEEKSSYLSNKVLLAGAIVLGLGISAIVFHQTGVVRNLFTAKLEEIPLNQLNKVSYTLDEIEFLKTINLEDNIVKKKDIVRGILSHFGKTNLKELLNGKMTINCLNNEFVFTFLTRLLNQATYLTYYEQYLKNIDGINTYVNASSLEELTGIKETVINGLNQIILQNPKRLILFKESMEHVLSIVASGKYYDFTPEIEKILVNDLIGYYLYQNVLDGVKPYYKGK
jgi:hypothetical protein